MDEAAKRLMKSLVARNCTPKEPIANAQLQAWAVEAGISDATIEHAGSKGWLTSGPRPGTTSMTQSGWDNGNA
jgi:hypothetical protein